MGSLSRAVPVRHQRRPYLKQIETESGIWFRDARKATNLRRALSDWPTPDGLKAQLDIDREAADAALKATPLDFGFDLRPYQLRAIQEVEKGLAADRRRMLLAMATGTGKTKLAIAMLYRLLAAKRFHRVCFVVDRSALGEQAEAEFRSTKVVSVKTFADIFGLKGLNDVAPDSETKVHICTIQGNTRHRVRAGGEIGGGRTRSSCVVLPQKRKRAIVPPDKASKRARAPSNGRGLHAVHSPPTPSAFNFMPSSKISAISCANAGDPQRRSPATATMSPSRWPRSRSQETSSPKS